MISFLLKEIWTTFGIRENPENHLKLEDVRSIKQRPKEADNRETAGHWVLYTVVFSRGKSKACLATIVERKTRFLFAVHMPNRKSSTYNTAIYRCLMNLPKSIVRSIAVDRGKEFAKYK